jgi:hypothetical protein
MKIEDAIKILQGDQERGVKSIIFAYWDAEVFGRQDDDEWEGIAEYVEDQMDWSNAHDSMLDLIEQNDDTTTEEV